MTAEEPPADRDPEPDTSPSDDSADDSADDSTDADEQPGDIPFEQAAAEHENPALE
ncbi:hypothetical protein ACFVU2_11450 [Leifsonia sp. NPDC058194]|uniref:hypothetical protein n=1 Tax=Leifsonia sp. NPDC058194 TaxID=3346374 RepID=UPI0036DF9994